MLDKLLRFYKDSCRFEVGDGFISGTDHITFATVLDKRFQGFPDGSIQNAELRRLIQAESFGYESGFLWIKNGNKKELIKIHTSLSINCKVNEKTFGKPKFESNGLIQAIRKAKVLVTSYISFKDSRARIFDSDRNLIFEIDVPSQFEQESLYNLKLVKKGIKMKNIDPAFSIIELWDGIHALRLCWDDFNMYIADCVWRS